MQKFIGLVGSSFESASHLVRSNSAQRSGNSRWIHLVQVVFCISSMVFELNGLLVGSSFIFPFTSTIPGPHDPRVASAASVASWVSEGVDEICQWRPSLTRHS